MIEERRSFDRGSKASGALGPPSQTASGCPIMGPGSNWKCNLYRRMRRGRDEKCTEHKYVQKDKLRRKCAN